MTVFKVGSQGPEVGAFQAFMVRKYASYWTVPVDEYFGYADRDAVTETQRRLGVPQTGMADEDLQRRVGFLKGAPTPRSDTWVYSAAGSFAPWFVGPPFDVGEAAKAAGKNHQPLNYPASGFLGLMGGDPSVSYLDSIAILHQEFVRCVLLNPEGSIEVVGYSQSADGLSKACAIEFADGGRLAHRRGDLKRLIFFGNPTRTPGPTKTGTNPPGSGISREYPPPWLQAITYDIVATTPVPDLYACAGDDTLVPLFYPLFVRAETELPFVIYVLQIIVPVLLNSFGFGLLGIGAGVPALAAILGLGSGMIGPLMGMLSGAPPPDPKIIQALSLQGLLSDIPKIIKTFIALVGIQTHNEYNLPKPEFGNRTGIEVGQRLVNEIA